MGAVIKYERQVFRLVGWIAVAIFVLSALVTSLLLSTLFAGSFVAAALLCTLFDELRVVRGNFFLVRIAWPHKMSINMR